MDKEDVMHLSNRVLFSHKRMKSGHFQKNDGTKNYHNQNILESEGHIQYIFLWYAYSTYINVYIYLYCVSI